MQRRKNNPNNDQLILTPPPQPWSPAQAAEPTFQSRCQNRLKARLCCEAPLSPTNAPPTPPQTQAGAPGTFSSILRHPSVLFSRFAQHNDTGWGTEDSQNQSEVPCQQWAWRACTERKWGVMRDPGPARSGSAQLSTQPSNYREPSRTAGQISLHPKPPSSLTANPSCSSRAGLDSDPPVWQRSHASSHPNAPPQLMHRCLFAATDSPRLPPHPLAFSSKT